MWDGIKSGSGIISRMTGREDHDFPLVQPLTPREQEILECLGNEMSNRQIAEQLTVSINTVKWYARQIYGKLGVDNRGDAVSLARSLGLLPDTRDGVIRHNLPAWLPVLPAPASAPFLTDVNNAKTRSSLSGQATAFHFAFDR